MSSQYAKRVMLDVMSIVFAWNERLLSDRQAIDKIIESLLLEKNDHNTAYTKTSKKSAGLLAIASGLTIILFVSVVSSDAIFSIDTKMLAESVEIRFEQQREMSSESKEILQNNTNKETFGNQMEFGGG